MRAMIGILGLLYNSGKICLLRYIGDVMEINIEFQISALMMMVMVMGVFFSKRRYDLLENRIYGVMVIACTLMLVVDIISTTTLADQERFGGVVAFWGHAYIVMLLLNIICLTTYNVSLTVRGRVGEASVFKKMLLFAWPATGIVLILVSLFLPLYPHGAGRQVYTYGPCIDFSYGVGGAAIAFMLLFTFCNRKTIHLKQQLQIYAYVMAEAVAAIIQNQNRYILISSYVLAVVLMFMYFTLENPDLKLIEEINDAKYEAERANRAKSAFLANMSHEIRTPINAVLGMDEMIIREAASPEIHEYALNIKNAGKMLLSLINDVLDFSKIESGKMEIVKANYRFSGVLKDLEQMIGYRANDKKLTFVMEVDETLPDRLYGDDVRLRQIIMNILTNAVKYTHKGSVTMRVSGQLVEGAGATDGAAMSEGAGSDEGRLFGNVLLHVEVQDTGIGIRSEDIEKLTKSFTRIEEERNRNIEGTGLGMSITTSLLGLMGSELKVESTYGKGSTFYFDVVQGVVENVPVGPRERWRSEEDINYGSRERFVAPQAHILVTDDNDMNLAVIKGLLKETEIQVDTAQSGQEAIQMMRAGEYHVCLLDHMMPGIDGIETLHRLRYEHICDDTPVIALTANAVSGAREEYRKMGFDDYLSKPVDVVLLENMLKKYIPQELVHVVEKNAVQGENAHVDESAVQGENAHVDGGTEYDENVYEASGVARDKNVHKVSNTARDGILQVDADVPQGAKDDQYGLLVAAGFDVRTALVHCAGMEDAYREFLGMFVAGAAQRKDKLDTFLGQDDLDGYRIEVHALKNNAYTLGMTNLGDMSLKLEKLARDGALEQVREGHGALVEMLGQYADVTKQWLS